MIMIAPGSASVLYLLSKAKEQDIETCALQQGSKPGEGIEMEDFAAQDSSKEGGALLNPQSASPSRQSGSADDEQKREKKLVEQHKAQKFLHVLVSS